MSSKIIGREVEQSILSHLVNSDKAEFIAVYGRRRVGKTFLIREYFRSVVHAEIQFYVMGILKGTIRQQLDAFQQELQRVFYQGSPIPSLRNWHHAFEILTRCVELVNGKKKIKNILIFLDELPWLATPKSGLLEALDKAWNRELKDIPNVKLVICGSAASWMIKKVIHAKGGLHNRLTSQMRLMPFTLGETKKFLEKKGFSYTHKQILEIYMALGGVPYYLDLLQKNLSAMQNIGQLCFGNGILVSEFEKLFRALFKNSEAHTKIIKALLTKKSGLTRQELTKVTKLPTGGKLSEWIQELKEAGFIDSITSFGKEVKDSQYKIVDEFISF